MFYWRVTIGENVEMLTCWEAFWFAIALCKKRRARSSAYVEGSAFDLLRLDPDELSERQLELVEIVRESNKARGCATVGPRDGIRRPKHRASEIPKRLEAPSRRFLESF